MAAAKLLFLSEMIMECLSAVFDLCKININLQQVRVLICINHPRDPLWFLNENVFFMILILKKHHCKYMQSKLCN